MNAPDLRMIGDLEDLDSNSDTDSRLFKNIIWLQEKTQKSGKGRQTSRGCLLSITWGFYAVAPNVQV